MHHKRKVKDMRWNMSLVTKLVRYEPSFLFRLLSIEYEMFKAKIIYRIIVIKLFLIDCYNKVVR